MLVNCVVRSWEKGAGVILGLNETDGVGEVLWFIFGERNFSTSLLQSISRLVGKFNGQ